MNTDDLTTYLTLASQKVDQALDRLLPAALVKPATLHRAMRYSLFAGGKRMRPVLVLAAAEACGGEWEPALPAAGAVECVHTYSLIHDDLPCMDDDDLRRGRPTCHKVFGEGIAVLAGDALVTAAFEMVAQIPPTKRYGVVDYVRDLAEAAGSRALIAGQVADLEAEGKKITRSQLRFIHEGKTAAMLRVSLRLGAMSANATPRQLGAVSEFGQKLGLAFQVIDDILDITQTSEKLGKSAGKDLRAEKSTYPALLGLAASRRIAKQLTKEAITSLQPFGKSGFRLRQIADYLLAREY